MALTGFKSLLLSIGFIKKKVGRTYPSWDRFWNKERFSRTCIEIKHIQTLHTVQIRTAGFLRCRTVDKGQQKWSHFPKYLVLCNTKSLHRCKLRILQVFQMIFLNVTFPYKWSKRATFGCGQIRNRLWKSHEVYPKIYTKIIHLILWNLGLVVYIDYISD